MAKTNNEEKASVGIYANEALVKKLEMVSKLVTPLDDVAALQEQMAANNDLIIYLQGYVIDVQRKRIGNLKAIIDPLKTMFNN